MKVYGHGHLRDERSAQMAQRVTFSLPKPTDAAAYSS